MGGGTNRKSGDTQPHAAGYGKVRGSHLKAKTWNWGSSQPASGVS